MTGVTGSGFACAYRQKLRADVTALRSELQSEREGREEEREGIMQEMARIKSRWVEFRLVRYLVFCCGYRIASLRAQARITELARTTELKKESFLAEERITELSFRITELSDSLSSFTWLPGSGSGYKRRRQNGSCAGNRGKSRCPARRDRVQEIEWVRERVSD